MEVIKMRAYEYEMVKEGTIVKIKERSGGINGGKRGVVIYKEDRWMLIKAINPDNKNNWFKTKGTSDGRPLLLTSYAECDLDDF